MRTFKKISVGFLSIAFALSTFAATLVPVQLLNPTGSTSGQAIVSTGASTAPAWGSVTATALAAQAANTVVANVTASSASPTAFAMPSCATALEWTSGTGFVCNTAGAFTTLSATGLITPSSTVGIKGTATSDSAQAGSIGEYAVYSTTGTSLTSNNAATCASTTTPLTAGDWEVDGQIQFLPASGTTTSGLIAGISTNPTAFINTPGTSVSNASVSNSAVPATQQSILMAPRTRITIATSTTIYMVGQATFAVSTMTCGGVIRARRVR